MIENCGLCSHLFSQTVMGLTVYGCAHPKFKVKKRPVVPQNSTRDLDTGHRIATFPRVPEWCPLPDGEARKQPESPATEEDVQRCSECGLLHGYHDNECSKRDLTHLAAPP